MALQVHLDLGGQQDRWSPDQKISRVFFWSQLQLSIMENIINNVPDNFVCNDLHSALAIKHFYTHFMEPGRKSYVGTGQRSNSVILL